MRTTEPIFGSFYVSRVIIGNAVRGATLATDGNQRGTP
jgi:hypothetical protein